MPTNPISQSRKAVVGFLVSLLAAVAADRGFDMDSQTVAWVTSVVTAVAVWLVPNDPKAGN